MTPISILLIEDNEGDIFLTQEALNEARIANEVTVIRDGWEATKFLEGKAPYEGEELPDLILLDINLPKLNGHEVLQKIKGNPELKHLPVIILTTSSSPEDVLSAYKNYVNCFITKPVDASDFLNVVSSIEDFWVSIVQLPNSGS